MSDTFFFANLPYSTPSSAAPTHSNPSPLNLLTSVQPQLIPQDCTLTMETAVVLLKQLEERRSTDCANLPEKELCFAGSWLQSYVQPVAENSGRHCNTVKIDMEAHDTDRR